MGIIYVKERNKKYSKEQRLEAVQATIPAEAQMHDTDAISSHCRVKNSTLLRSRVDFLIKCFCFSLST